MWARDTFRAQLWSWCVFGLMLLIVLLAASACKREAEPPVLLGFEPPTPTVHAGASMYLRVVYAQKQAKVYDFLWTVEAGAIRGNRLAAVAYDAPDTPGTYRLSVTVTYGSARKTVSLDGTITVLPAPAPPSPAPVAQARPVSPPAPGPRGAAPGAPPQPAAKPSVVEKLVQHGRFTAAVQREFPPFSYIDAEGKRVGFDIDLMRECARRWVGDGNAVTLLPVFTKQRIPALLEGKADIMAAALTTTPARQRLIDFSHTYFKDGQRLLVRQDSPVTGVCDLHGKKIAVTHGSTAIDNVQKQASACGFTADLVYVDAPPVAAAAILRGDADAFSTDSLALEQLARGQPLHVVGNHFSDEPYGLGVPKGDATFLRLVNLTLEAMAADGTLAAIYHKWFQDSLRPYPIPALDAAAAAPNLLTLATTDLPPLFAPVPEAVPVATTYTVQKGDTLSRIAGKVYGDVSPASWRRIYAANKDLIGPNPSRIQVGMALTIPAP